MSVELILLGTGDAGQIPVFGCQCKICVSSRTIASFRRKACSALIRYQNQVILIDSGLIDLASRLQNENLKAIVQTHYHPDHAQGLLHIRWGVGNSIPVYGPQDEEGFADLYKHPGILSFQTPWQHGQMFEWGDLTITALNMNHSKPTLGYVLSYAGKNVAYFTDTVGLPDETIAWLQDCHLDCMVIDCSTPPMTIRPRNHNDLNLVYEIESQISCDEVVLTHLGHKMDLWLQNPKNKQSLPKNYRVALDNDKFILK